MRFIIVTQDDPFYIPHFFKEFDRIFIDKNLELLGVVIQTPLGKKSLYELIIQMYNFYGFYGFIKIGLKYSIYKLLNIIAVKIFKGRFPGVFSLKHFLLKKNYKILDITNINSKKSVEQLKEMNLDLIVSVAASQKFREKVISIPKFGCINIHNSRLPKNRGMLPNFWALYNSDTTPLSGITVHKMNASLDDGPIVLQEDLLLDSKESLNKLIIRTKKRNAHLILRAVKMFIGGEPPLLQNDSSLATYNTFPTKKDVELFKKKGLKLL